ncbi:MAG: amidohydrolase [Lachnospiraceae bacterium]|nr:amidohydrolase [Lachnospiraceae bacterium]
MNIRFYNARILTMEEPIEVITGQLWVSGERIIYVGTSGSEEEICTKLNIAQPIWDREIDCNGNLLMPGFKDAHAHSAMVLFRSVADDEPLQGWLEKRIFPVEGQMTGEDVYELTKMSVLEYLTSGITAVFDMYLTPETIIDAYTECGMRNVQVSGINNFGPEPSVMEERFQKLNAKNSLSSYMLGLHAEYTCSMELLETVAEMVHKYKAPFFAHNSETELEVKECFERYGMSPTQLFDKLGLFDYGGGGYHCIYFDEKDFEIFKKRGLTAVTNPASNLKLASGIAPVARFLEEGIPVAIGTDGAGSNNCLDMFREMFLVTGLAKYLNKDAASVDALEVLRMATVNGAKAMGLTECDVLAEGKYADLIMIDMHQPNMQPINNIAKNIVYSGSKQNVKMTMINGKILYEDGRFDIGEDPESLYAKANAIAERFK